MEYIYAALLLYKAGKEITESGVVSILEAAGIKVDDYRVKALISALDGVNIEEAISKSVLLNNNQINNTNNNVNNNENKVDEKENTEKEEKEPDHSEEDGMAGLGALFG